MRLIYTLIFLLPIHIGVGFLSLNAQSLFPHVNSFIKNNGQILTQDNEANSNVLFLFVGKGLKIQLRKDGYSYEMFSFKDLPAFDPAKKFFEDPSKLTKTKIINSRVDIDFLKMNSNVEVISEGPQSEALNFICSGKEVYGVKQYKKVTYKNIYDNIDIEFTLTGNDLNPLKYNIILHPGAKIDQIKFLCQGAFSIKKTANEIKISTALGEITERIPFSYYTDEPNQNQQVDFGLFNNIISFTCLYNSRKTLVIDPSSNIIWGSYFGGPSIEYCSATGIDAQNNLYITGHTLSTSNIATLGAFQTTLNGNFDLYVAKFSSAGALQWGTYFGGTNYETGLGIFVEPTGNIFVCGNSGSTVNVASPGAHQTVYGGGIDDAILIKFNPAGQRLWSTYYGGNLHDIAFCLTLDNIGNVIIAGHTESINTGSAIATAGAYATAFSFYVDAFIAKFNTNGVRLFGTYYGDSGFEEAWGVATDASGNIIITGFTSSIAGISVPPCYQVNPGGGNEAFIAKFDPSCANIIWATYYGGTADEQGAAIKINSGNIYVTGNTGSSNAISTAGSYQTAPGSSEDVFVVCFNASGVRQWGTYYGGNGSDYVSDIIFDAQNNLLICGNTISTNSISTIGAYQPTIGLVNTYDAFFAKFYNNGTNLILASYYGSDGGDYGKGIAIDNTGKLYMAGETSSTNGLTTPGAYMQSPGGGNDGFLVKFCLAPQPVISPAGNATVCANVTYTLFAPNGYASYIWSNNTFSNSLILTPPLSPGNYYYTVSVNDSFGCSGMSDSTHVTIINCATGLIDALNKDGLKIFPVPAIDFIFIENLDLNTAKNFGIEIYSSIGQLILQNEIKNNDFSINIKDLNTGIYFLKLKGTENISVKKFIKL